MKSLSLAICQPRVLIVIVIVIIDIVVDIVIATYTVTTLWPERVKLGPKEYVAVPVFVIVTLSSCDPLFVQYLLSSLYPLCVILMSSIPNLSSC
jgi:hypothetical protein